MLSTAPLAAAILAGGAARRMGGRNKALLPLQTSSIIERQIPVLRLVADPIVIVAPDPGPFEGLGLAVIPDRLPGCGALGGIYTAVETAAHDRVLVVACDMPFLQRRVLEAMAARQRADIVIPRSRTGLEPLCAIYSRTCGEAIRRRLETGALQASILPEGVSVEEIGTEALAVFDPDGLMFVNVNTPHDYERARELADSPSKPAQDRIMDET